MRQIFSTLFLLATFALAAQITTYYVTPPTSGCNGVWAVNGFSMSCGSAPYMYNTQPLGCLQTLGWTSSADTIFIPLCALPCSLLITNADGVNCGGDVDPSTTVVEGNARPDLRITTGSSGIEIKSTCAMAAGTFRLLDMGGRVLRTHNATPGSRWQMQLPDAPGSYLITFDGGGVELRERFVWAR